MFEVDVSIPTINTSYSEIKLKPKGAFTQGESGAAKDHGSQQIIIICTKL